MRSRWTAPAETSSNFKCEQGHLDSLNTGQTCTQESVWNFSRARCLPRCVSTWFIHSERLWMSIIPGWSEETHIGQKSQESCEVEVVCQDPHGWYPFSRLLVFSGCFLSTVSVNICSFLHYYSFFSTLFIQRVLRWEHMPFFVMDWNPCSLKHASELPNRPLKPAYIFTRWLWILCLNWLVSGVPCYTVL